MKSILCKVHVIFPVLAIWLSFMVPVGAVATEQSDSQEGRVYVMKNESTANKIVVLKRDQDGRLNLLQEVPTGGIGSGPGTFPPPLPQNIPGPNGIDSQDSLVATEDGHFLIAVNPGSNDVSVLEATNDGLQLVDKVPSGGIFPISIALHHDLVYVLNGGSKPHAGGTPTLRGFHLDHNGKLIEIEGSTIQEGPEASEASDAVFSPNGKLLIVSEQLTQRIDVFHVDDQGLLRDRTSFPANNSAPLGIAFGHNIMAVTEGATSAPRIPIPNGSTMSSYRLTDNDTFEPISSAVPTTQTAACWVRFTPDGRYAYTGNTSSSSLSSFSVSPHGELTLLQAVAANTGMRSIPIDLSITPNGRYLYVLGSFIGTVEGFRIESDGSLTPVDSFGGLPITIQGIVAR